MLDLFTRPELWERARSRVTVFKFYPAQILADETGYPECGPNRLPNLARVGAFPQIRAWGLWIAVEVAVIKSWGCQAEVTASVALEAVARVQANGGFVRYLALDEPLLGGADCGLTLDESARETAAFVRAVRDEHPAIEVGDIEPYPAFAAAPLASWLQALRREQVPLAFFHVDVDRVRADDLGSDVAADLRSLRSACRSQGARFGVILWGADGTTEKTYSEDVLDWTRRVGAAVGAPDDTVFQSWSLSADGVYRVPMNLPENDPAVFSHTRLVNEGLAILDATTRAHAP